MEAIRREQLGVLLSEHLDECRISPLRREVLYKRMVDGAAHLVDGGFPGDLLSELEMTANVINAGLGVIDLLGMWLSGRYTNGKLDGYEEMLYGVIWYLIKGTREGNPIRESEGSREIANQMIRAELEDLLEICTSGATRDE